MGFIPSEHVDDAKRFKWVDAMDEEQEEGDDASEEDESEAESESEAEVEAKAAPRAGRTTGRKRVSRVLMVDGHSVLRENNYDMEGGERR